MAGLIIASQKGLEDQDSLDIAKDLYVDVNIFKEENREKLESLEHLPNSCWESAKCLNAKRSVYEKNGIFPAGTIDNFITKLQGYNDKDLSERLYGKHEEVASLVKEYLHWM